MIISGQLKESDIINAHYLHSTYKKKILWLNLLLSIILLCAAFFLNNKISNTFVILGICNLIPVLMYWITPFILKRNFRKNKSLSVQSNIEFRENGIFFKTQYGENLMPWEHIIKWKKNEKLILIFPQKNLYYPIPSHYFESCQAFLEFAEKLEIQLGKPK